MYLDRILAAKSGTQLVTRDSLAAAQWEAVLAEAGVLGGGSVWQSHPLASFSRWLEASWESGQLSSVNPGGHCLLSAPQTDRLWQRIIEDSAEGAALISTAGVARWARAARRSLLDCGQSPQEQSGSAWHGDSAAFLRWNAQFERYLARAGWIDPDSLLYRINRLPVPSVTSDLIFLDPEVASPELIRLSKRWEAGGVAVDSLWPDEPAASRQLLLAGDPTAELELAANWAARLLERQSTARVAIVVPDLEIRHEEVERVFADRVAENQISSQRSQSIGDVGIFGAALTALRLLAPGADFATLSRWLRSPFFCSQDEDRGPQTIALELALRHDPRAQQSFVAAYRQHGLRAEFLSRVPGVAQQLDQALNRLPRRATPTSWAQHWQACLKALDWQGFQIALPDALHVAWDGAWARFAELTVVTGSLDMAAALDEFERVVAAQSIYQPLTLSGVHLVSRISQIGPGYKGAWIMGFTDQSWPEPPEQNPLVPWSVQRALGFPGSRPEAILESSGTAMARLLCRVPEANFSCPQRILDQPQIPNACFSEWAHIAASPAAVPTDRYAESRIGARLLETAADPAPPLTGTRIPGGPRTLDLQSLCPVQAFCVARLGAEPLELPVRGIHPRLRGILLHRVLELLLRPGFDGDAKHRLESCMAQAFAELTPPGDASWQSQLSAEKARILRLVGGFLELESRREAFRVVAVERRTEIEIGGHRLSCRIDRLDHLGTNAELLIDYKTGRRPITGLFNLRLSDCQLPLYAQHDAGTIAAIAVVSLNEEKIEYRAAGREVDALPGRQRVFTAAEWDAQLDRWRDQLVTLIDEFAGGDVRIFTDQAGLAGGAFGALTRNGDSLR